MGKVMLTNHIWTLRENCNTYLICTTTDLSFTRLTLIKVK